MFVWLALACAPAEDPSPTSPPNETSDTPVSTTPTGGNGTGTPTDTAAPDCALAPVALSVGLVEGQVTEGLAFTSTGALLGCSDQHLFQTVQGEESTVLTPGAGVHGDLVTLSDDRVVLADGWHNKMLLVHPNGASETLIDGLMFPNSLAVASDDTVYIAEWFGDRVLALDPNTGEVDTLTSALTAPFGIALSRDEQTLYVAATNGPGGVWTLGVNGGAVTPIHPTAGHHPEGLRVDRCGVLYLMEVDGIYRYQPENEVLELAVTNPDTQQYWGGFTAGEFGSGSGGRDVEKLYAVLYGNPAQVVEVTLRSP